MRQKMGLEKLTSRHWLGGLVLIIGLIGLITVLTQQQLEEKTIDRQIDQMSPEELQASPTALAKKEEDVLNRMLEISSGVTSSADKCEPIIKNQDTCYVAESATLITRPEWQELFPHTQFFLIEGKLYGGELRQQSNFLIIEQAGKRYSAGSFDRLLHDNDVVITDDNQELVVQAIALITIPDYLTKEVHFIDWSPIDPSTSIYHYTHIVQAWTQINGIEFEWAFVFKNENLRMVTGPSVLGQTGDFIVDMYTHLPQGKDYQFLGE